MVDGEPTLGLPSPVLNVRKARNSRPCLVPFSLLFLFVSVHRDIRQEVFRAGHTHWRGVSFVYNHYLFFGCFLVVLLSILLYLLRLRRIHRRAPRTGSLWMEEGLPSQKGPGPL